MDYLGQRNLWGSTKPLPPPPPETQMFAGPEPEPVRKTIKKKKKAGTKPERKLKENYEKKVSVMFGEHFLKIQLAVG